MKFQTTASWSALHNYHYLIRPIPRHNLIRIRSRNFHVRSLHVQLPCMLSHKSSPVTKSSYFCHFYYYLLTLYFYKFTVIFHLFLCRIPDARNTKFQMTERWSALHNYQYLIRPILRHNLIRIRSRNFHVRSLDVQLPCMFLCPYFMVDHPRCLGS